MPVSMDNLAAAAELHAGEQHAVGPPITLAQTDQILDRERGGQASDALVACYGAWFGQQLLAGFSGVWVGMHEPVPPRIQIAGRFYSPFDAVARRLKSNDAPSLSDLANGLEESLGMRPLPTVQASLEQNLAYWNNADIDSQFVNLDWLPGSREEAIAALDPWLRSEGIEGKELLCLAAGGGTHGPLYAVAGAKATVVDFSQRLLSIDHRFAEKFGLSLATNCCSMDALPQGFEAKFDMVIQPVSMCYVGNPDQVYAEISRVLKPGGLYIAQHKNPSSLQLAMSLETGYHMAYSQSETEPLPIDSGDWEQRESNAAEFTHSLEKLIGGVCRHGFVIEDFCEPLRADAWAPVGSGPHRALFAPPYMKIKARRV